MASSWEGVSSELFLNLTNSPTFGLPKRPVGPMLDLHVHDAHFIQLLFGKPHSVSTHGRLRGELAEFFHTQFHFPKESYVVEATCGTIAQQGRPFSSWI